MKKIVKATNVKKSSIKVENVTKKKHKNIKLKNAVAADKSKPAKKSKSVKKGTAAKPGSAPDDLPSSPLEDARLAATCCLRWMLAPVTTDQFFNEFWEQQPLLVSRSSSTHYAGVFSTDHFDRILREELIHYGRNLDVTSYSCGQRETHNPVGRAHAPVVWDYYSNGCSLRLINPQTYSQSVWRLCSTLQEYFGTLVGANVYLTPAGTQGFAPHYDDIEGFLLQLEGAKHWRVYKAREGEQLARVSSVNFSEDDITQETDTASDTSPSRSPSCRLIPPPELLIDAVLHAGDLLYIPRGCIHQGRALCNQHSLHITVSTYQRTSWADLLEKVIPLALQRAISENVQLRRCLPVGYRNYMGLVHDHQQHSPVNTKLREEFIAEAASLIDKVCRNLPLDAAVDQQVKQYLMDALPPTLTSDKLKRTVHNDGERWSEGRVRGRAVIDPVTEVKLVRPSAIRLIEIPAMSRESDSSSTECRDPAKWGKVEMVASNLSRDYREERAQVDKVRAYRSIHHFVSLINDVGADHPTPAMSCTLTGLCYMFPHLLPRNAVFVLPVDSPDAKVKSRSRIVQMAFMAACHLVKPVTADNKLYLTKRWNAGIASVIGGHNLIAAYETSPVTDEVLSNCCEAIHNHTSPKEIVIELMKEVPDVFPIICRAMRAQLNLVYQRAGMVALELMNRYCTSPINAAITFRSVWTQVVDFVDKYRQARAKVEENHPGGWLYARILCEDALLPLAASQFPDLYYTAIKTAKRCGELDARQFDISDRGEGGSRALIDRLIRVRVTQAHVAGNDELKEALKRVGLDLRRLVRNTDN